MDGESVRPEKAASPEPVPSVRLNLYAALRDRYPGLAGKELPLREGETVGALLERLGISSGRTGIIMVNSAREAPDAVLKGGDTIHLFPMLGGG